MKHMEEYPDEELIDMYRAGNEQAIEYIFERYKYICLLYTSDAADEL